MIRQMVLVSFLALSITAASGWASDTPAEGTRPASTTTGQTRGEAAGKIDAKHFVYTAGQDGIAEVQLGMLAKSKASRDEVKRFADTMVADHTRANDELQAMAAAKKLKLPKEMNAEQKKTMARLKKLTGKSFENAYINAMVKDHEKAVQLFEQASIQLEDAELKAWASRTLPTLQHHLEMAKAMKGGGAGAPQKPASDSKK